MISGGMRRSSRARRGAASRASDRAEAERKAWVRALGQRGTIISSVARTTSYGWHHDGHPGRTSGIGTAGHPGHPIGVCPVLSHRVRDKCPEKSRPCPVSYLVLKHEDVHE